MYHRFIFTHNLNLIHKANISLFRSIFVFRTKSENESRTNAFARMCFCVCGLTCTAVCRHFRETTKPYKRDHLEYLDQYRMATRPCGPAQLPRTPSTLQWQKMDFFLWIKVRIEWSNNTQNAWMNYDKKWSETTATIAATDVCECADARKKKMWININIEFSFEPSKCVCVWQTKNSFAIYVCFECDVPMRPLNSFVQCTFCACDCTHAHVSNYKFVYALITLSRFVSFLSHATASVIHISQR